MPDWLLPDHVSDTLPAEARRMEELRRLLLDKYRSYGYELIAPPLIENLDSLLTGSGSRLAMRTFQTVDQFSGKTLGVRADMTPQAARIDAHLLNRNSICRLCYAGPVLHTRPANLLATREPYQIGAELFGHQGVEAEGEVLELMVESLQTAGLDSIRIDLGHSAIVPALLELAAQDGWTIEGRTDRDTLYELLVQKDSRGLSAFLADCSQPARDGLLALVQLYGRVSAQDFAVLDDAAARLPDNPVIGQALQSLRSLAGLAIWSHHPDVQLAIDLADLQGYHYYSGVSFTAFALPAAGTGFHGQALARGGRYDGIGKAFGRERAAVGFSLELRQVSALGLDADADLSAAILAPWVDNALLGEAISKLRQQGEIVVQALPGHEPEQEEFDCDRQLVLQDGAWVVTPLVTHSG